MSENLVTHEKFTGLILLTGDDKPGIAHGLFSTLADFSIEILDVEQLVISDRLVLTALIALNSAHQGAIETDLNTFAAHSDVDIAVLFGKKLPSQQVSELVSILVSKAKLHPHDLKLITEKLLELNLNIEAIARRSTSPTIVELRVSGGSEDLILAALETLNFEDKSTFVVRSV
jgi:phosphoserine phosphatase